MRRGRSRSRRPRPRGAPHPLRRLRRRSALLLVPIVLGLIVLDRRGLLLVPAADELAEYHGRTAHLVHVVDGDTIDVSLADRKAATPTTRIRLWGLDCPETATPDRPAEAYAEAARRFTTAVAGPSALTLFLEPGRVRGTYGRVLAHVDLPDGTCLNEALLAAGLARLDERWPHGRLARYAAAQHAAMAAARGMWAQGGAARDRAPGGAPAARPRRRAGRPAGRQSRRAVPRPPGDPGSGRLGPRMRPR
jgi:micrococcal nuclease